MDALRFKILGIIQNLKTGNSVEAVFNFYYEKFLFSNSDEVRIDGKIYSKVERQLMLLPNKLGESNLKDKEIEISRTLDGLPLIESDFINSELEYLTIENLKPTSITEKKLFQLYYDYLQNRIQQNPTIKSNQLAKENPFPRLFKNIHAFNFFESLESMVRKPLTDYSFIFRRMQKDEFIFSDIKEREFRDFLIEQEKVSDIDKLKGLAYCTTTYKESVYNSKKIGYPLI
jgi:hypothetical protein